MTVFRYEWKKNFRYIICWTLAVGVLILCMIPAYYGALDSVGSLSKIYENSEFYDSLGMTADLFQEPLGMYAFLNVFFSMAIGIFGMYLGMSLYTKECTGGTAEYLMTKPIGRMQIFREKNLCMLGGIMLAGAAYVLSSYTTLSLMGIECSERFLPVALSFVLTALFFGVLGVWVGVYKPAIQSPLVVAGLTVFTAYCLTSFSRIAGVPLIDFLSPFSFFEVGYIFSEGFYPPAYLVWYVLFVAVLYLSAAIRFKSKDVTFTV